MQVAAVAPDADCLQLTADVGDADQLTEVFATTIERFGRLDVVINNAGMKTAAPGFPEGSVAMIDQVLNTNLRGVIIGTQLAHRHMAANGGGSIVSTASGAGKMPLPTDPLYATTKAGVINFTQSCAPLFAADGVRINAVCPDIVDTPMFTGKGHSPELTAIIEAMTMLRPDEVATAIVDLALDLDTTGATPSVIGHPDGFRLV